MILAIQTLQHFAVDGICAANLARYAIDEEFFDQIVLYFGIYNLIAFGTQWLMGLAIDRKFIGIKIAFGISLATLSIGSIQSLGIMNQAILLGIGNSIFHVAGGSLVLNRYQTFKELGIFVSSGAIGLALGLNGIVSFEIFLPLYWALTILFLKRFHGELELPIQTESIQREDPKTLAMLICAILLLSCIVLRGFGRGVPTEFVMLFPCVLAIGKSLGGFVCDRFGFRRTILAILLIGTVAIQFEGLAPILILTLALNMTMPLTLRLVHWCNPKFPGMMFGLAAGCLLPGAFFHESIPPQVTVSIQFLTLFIAGYLIQKFAREDFDARYRTSYSGN